MLKFCFLAMLIGSSSLLPAREKRMIVIMAHPDDCELTTGGTAILLSAMGYEVKFVSLTNGNAGHHKNTKSEIAKRRQLEVQEVKKRLGCAYEIINNNDGELTASLENRLEVIRLIREWNADIVITHPPYDYHPDHRNASMLVQDAAFLVNVPLILPEVGALKQSPLFLYAKGRYTNPLKPQPDIVVDISTVVREKANILDAHESQFYEWLPWINRSTAPIPESREERLQYLEDLYVRKRGVVQEVDKEALNKWYGGLHAEKVTTLETFEVCAFGRSVADQDIRDLFPMFNREK